MIKNLKRDVQYYLLANKRFYESMDRYDHKESDYLSQILPKLNADWKILRHGIWINCISKQDFPDQGWKIHLSSLPEHSREMLNVVSNFLIKKGVSFKFLLDKRILAITSSKAWSRGGSGKFITIYPSSEPEFRDLLQQLETMTGHFVGPYILSDKRYKDSKVLYYRYGGLKFTGRLNSRGQKVPVLISPQGEERADMRNPYYTLPDWVEEVFPETPKNEQPGLDNGRFIVEKALSFSNSGGVYLAKDLSTGKEVVIKEARPHIQFAKGIEAIELLRKEYRLLQKLESLAIAPKPVHSFQEWEHFFIVEEYLQAYVPLSDIAAQENIVLSTRPTKQTIAAFLEKYLTICGNLADLIDRLHGAGVVFGDFSINNIMVGAALNVKLIDFEGACDLSSGDKCALFTPGFADDEQMRGGKLTLENDYYAFGSVMLYYLTHLNNVQEIKPEMPAAAVREIIRDFGLPESLGDAIATLRDKNPLNRCSPKLLLSKISNKLSEPVDGLFPKDQPHGDNAALIRGAAEFIINSADYSRKDRLFPADPEVFETNPLSVAHGVTGILLTLSKLAPEHISPEMTAWLLDKPITPKNYPPGLYLGISGIAWGLLELGHTGRAEDTLRLSFNHPLLEKGHGLYYGLAGWGLTNLKFWLKTRKGIYLENAIAAAETLLRSSNKDGDTMCWMEGGKTELGFAHGASGVGLFFLYLHLATQKAAYADAARRALDFDLSNMVATKDEGLSCPKSKEDTKIIYPYLEYGSAGVGMACLRYLNVFGDKKYKLALDKIHIDCDRKYAVFPGRDLGLAGIGEFLWDAHLLTGDGKYKNSAERLAAGIRMFAIQAENGIAFPGNGLFRISCDYATGIAGIASFISRLGTSRKSDFMLDELLKENPL